MSRLILAFLFCFVSSASFANKKCASILPTDATSNLIGYLGSVVEQGFVKAEGLQSLKDSIASGELVHPISGEQASRQIALELHRQGIAGLLMERIDPTKLGEWLEVTLGKMNSDARSQHIVKIDTESLVVPLSFVKVPKGEFWSGDRVAVKRARAYEVEGMSRDDIAGLIDQLDFKRAFRVKLLQDYEISSTVITQQQWLDVMGQLPESVHLHETHNERTPRGKLYSPNHPITSVSFWSMLVFANKLSESQGLDPVYLFDESFFDTGKHSFFESAAKGKLDFKIDPSNNYNSYDLPLSINESDEDYYKTNGFRLPTRYEVEYLGRYGQGKYTSYHFGYTLWDIKADANEFAWTRQESVMPVALKKPLIISAGHEIFDYHGNTKEALFHWSYELKEDEANPQAQFRKRHATQKVEVFGIDVGDFREDIATYSFSTRLLHEEMERTGFRLVRSLP